MKDIMKLKPIFLFLADECSFMSLDILNILRPWPLVSPLAVPAFFIRSLLKVDYNLSNFMMKGIQQRTRLWRKNTTETPLHTHKYICVFLWVPIDKQQKREQ